MEDYPEVACDDCSWEGLTEELVCSDEDYKSDLPSKDIKFNLCPRCDSSNIVDTDYSD